MTEHSQRSEPGEARPDAELRLAIFDHKRGWQMGVFGAALVVLFCVIFYGGALLEINDTDLKSMPVDFFVFWAAGTLAMQGLPLDAFDPNRLMEVAASSNLDWMAWLYPPGFLMMITPLGLFSFIPALTLFSVVSLAALAWASWPFCARRVQVLLCFTIAPVMLPSLLTGQISILWCAGLVGALAALHANRPVLAGVLIGLLTLKPQLGLLIPFALLACRAWPTIIAATLTTIAITVLPTLFYGVEYWTELLAIIKVHSGLMRAEIANLDLVISTYAFLVTVGLPDMIAFYAQWALTVFCAGVVFLVWHNHALGFDLKAAVLLTAIPLSSPYLWYYESAMLAPAALFMFRAGVVSSKMPGLLLGVCMWLGLAPAVILHVAFEWAHIVQYTYMTIALLAFAACLRHAFFARSQSERTA